MIVDARLLPEDEVVETDVCIIGAGPAGIALAREYLGSDVRVCLLESGGLEHDEATMSLAEGESTGIPYDRLAGARYRAFGGSSHAWSIDVGGGAPAARLHPLDPIDFERRAWVPYSGWPFDRAHLDPFYDRAHEFLGTGPATSDESSWFPPSSPEDPSVRSDAMEATVFQFTRSDVLRGVHRDAIHRSGNVTSMLFANVTEIETNEQGTAIDRVTVSSLGGTGNVLMPAGTGWSRVRVADMREKRFSVTARTFILAAGATENARLLLLSRRRLPSGLGNQYDLVGRYFMEHPHIWSGHFVPAHPAFGSRGSRYRIQEVAGVPVMAKWVTTDLVRRREGLLGYCVSIHPVAASPVPDGLHSLLRIARAARERKAPTALARHVGRVVRGGADITAYAYAKYAAKRPPRGHGLFRLDHMAEQTPNPQSRVTLSDDRDALGMPRVKLEWRLNAGDIRSMVRSQQIIDRELRRAGVGRLHLELDGDEPPEGLRGGWHHMGTTRMHTDPKQGVVNEHGRVHGVANLYVAGSSVFPTAGYANPLLTICALAIRLADHVKGEVAARPVSLVSGD